MSLEVVIEDIRNGIKTGRFSNEAAVSQGIVLRLLDTLSWPAYDTQIVCPEYSLGGRRVDYALCHPPGRPIAFIEVKQIGQSEGAERQLFEYAFHEGVPLAILTDGREWNFFLPAGQGDYGDRRVYKLDLIEREVSESATRLNRYLNYEAIKSGAASKNALEDYNNASRVKQMESTLPRAWESLLAEEDEILLELVADRVESLCGYKPNLDMVAHFLKKRGKVPEIAPSTNQLLKPPTYPPHPTRPRNSVGTGPVTIGFIFKGKEHSARNGKDVMVKIFELLAKRDATFLDRLDVVFHNQKLKNKKKTRRALAKNLEDLYDNKDMEWKTKYSERLSTGHWVGTNYGIREIEGFIQTACEVASLDYGKDLIVNLGD